jgi:hypothetical protein
MSPFAAAEQKKSAERGEECTTWDCGEGKTIFYSLCEWSSDYEMMIVVLYVAASFWFFLNVKV